MNQESDGARMHGLAAPCEALEGKRRRGRSAWIKIGRAEFTRERSDHPLRPSIERMRLSVPCFGRVLEGAPLITPGEAEQYDSSRYRRAGCFAEFTRPRMKGAAHRETAQDSAPRQLIEIEHGKA